ncbi:hypothetical protein E2562_016493 [Oryza meyeriana var. granulata]|uniref:Uncharacterized protein n=1 Tax=Oryza meyeriana var. granulata TaxID=110450 RepID=A0A6G1BLU8_9ORYZ|nr:hypothetical protein E2562_016493 [Oryza meyeriana var. granulata]
MSFARISHQHWPCRAMPRQCSPSYAACASLIVRSRTGQALAITCRSGRPSRTIPATAPSHPYCAMPAMAASRHAENTAARITPTPMEANRKGERKTEEQQQKRKEEAASGRCCAGPPRYTAAPSPGSAVPDHRATCCRTLTRLPRRTAMLTSRRRKEDTKKEERRTIKERERKNELKKRNDLVIL